METSTAISKIAALLFLVVACLTATLAITIYNHAPLVAYGLESPTPVAVAISTGFGLTALVWLWFALRTWRSDRVRFLRLAAACILGFLLCALAVLGVYALDFKYEKGDSNLLHLGAYCRDLSTWQSRAVLLRAGILRAAQLDPPPERTPLNPILHSRREHAACVVENVILETVPGFFLAGNLYRPLPADDGVKKPVVLIPHGHFPNGRFSEDTQELAATFARMGALAFLYDMAGRGETTQVDHGNPHALTLQLWDSMRSLDFLLALPDADATRVGMTGASGGGTQTFLCTAVDPRVTVSAPVVMVSSWMYGGCACESGLPIHNTPEYRTNNAEIAAMAAPRPQLIISIDEDWTRTVPTREFPYIRGVYRLFGKEDCVRNVHLHGEHHDYGPSKRDAVLRFFAEHLNLPLNRVLGPNGAIDETPNVMETREAMSAFNDAHPLPNDALRGWDAVVAALHKR